MTAGKRIGLTLGGLVLLAVLGFAGLVWLGRVLPPAGTTATVGPGAAGLTAPAATPGLLTVPVAGVKRSTIADSWGDPRDNGRRAHHGTDIPALAGTPVLAAGPGRIEKLWKSQAGGTTIYERAADGRWIYYYAHLAGYAPGLREGQAVAAGQPIGLVGDTGDAGPGNFHLHFGLTRMAAGEHWYQGQDVNAWPYLAGPGGRR